MSKALKLSLITTSYIVAKIQFNKSHYVIEEEIKRKFSHVFEKSIGIAN